jgi:hypothetical protein
MGRVSGVRKCTSPASMLVTLQDLKLDHLVLVYPGDKIFPLAPGMAAYGHEIVVNGDFAKQLSVALS